MRRVVSHYANGVLSMCVALGIFFILFHASSENRQNFPVLLGTIMESASISHTTTVRTGTAFDERMNRIAPRIMQRDYYLTKGTEVHISSIVFIRDQKGKYVNPVIEACWDENFQNSEMNYVTDETTLHMREAGVMWLQVSGTDEKGYTSRAIIKIFINER